MAAQDYFASFAPQQQQRPVFQSPQPSRYSPTNFPEVNTPHNQQLMPAQNQSTPHAQQPYPYYPGPPMPQQRPQSQSQSQSPFPLTPPYPTSSSPYTVQYPQHQQFAPPPRKPSNPNGLFPPMRPVRSKSEPSEIDRYRGEEPERHRHRHHHRSRSRRRSDEGYDSYDSDERSRSRARSRRASRADSHDKSRRNRDTFLGAGGGALIGDAIFPGAGTLGGLLLGGLGGNHYARQRSRSELPPHDHERYRDGITVKSGWVRR